MGAVGEDGICVLDHEVLRSAHVGRVDLERVTVRERARVESQSATFRRGRPKISLAGRTLVLVDDGIATGSSMLAACQVARAHRPAAIVVAVPVAPRGVTEVMRGAADELVCLHTPEPFMAVGLWYHDFSQVSDDEVIALLTRDPKGPFGPVSGGPSGRG